MPGAKLCHALAIIWDRLGGNRGDESFEEPTDTLLSLIEGIDDCHVAVAAKPFAAVSYYFKMEDVAILFNGLGAFEGLGGGTACVEHLLTVARGRNSKLLIAKAARDAESFYSRQGFVYVTKKGQKLGPDAIIDMVTPAALERQIPAKRVGRLLHGLGKRFSFHFAIMVLWL